MTAATNVPLHVAAGVLIDARGRILLAQRPPGRHLAGRWEFPGGKLEPGETVAQALHRELDEELGIDIDVDSVEPLMRLPWRYGDKSLLLEALCVRVWRGEPHPHEGQALNWCHPDEAVDLPLAPADRPLLNRLRLPACYPITPPAADAASARALVTRALGSGRRLLQLRLPSVEREDARALAADLQPAAVAVGAALLLNGDIEGARALGRGAGVHLRSDQLRVLTERPLAPDQWVGASCHDADELRLAAALGLDFAMLSPVLGSTRHEHRRALGWTGLAAMLADAALPVFALGGVAPGDIASAQAAGACGVAGIRAFWP